jgi:hypothetical protein
MGRRTRRLRRTRRNRQRGGGGCSARPANGQMFNFSQRGGQAPYNTSGSLLDQQMMDEAGTYGQIAAINQATALAIGPGQMGGRRRRRRHRRSQRGGDFQSFNAPYDHGFHNNGTNPQWTEYLDPQLGTR